ncbi:Uncharacterised protein [Bartonella grahamii]|uniref:Uncharacterized protein n=1 Tax=Bartonella grahamii TaxID=33045 RepID=A0A336NGB9_BARGR|nr:Uncharacterised protein [Bartonella grahamii]
MKIFQWYMRMIQLFLLFFILKKRLFERKIDFINKKVAYFVAIFDKVYTDNNTSVVIALI